jgi:hypothetical protein
MGPVTEAVRNLFFRVVQGRVPQYRDWLSPVYEPEREQG